MSQAKRILVIDDDAASRGLMEQILLEDGHAVTVCSDGAEAIRLLGDERARGDEFDAVVSDIRMVEADGLEVLDWVRTHAVETPVLLVTAFGNVDGAVDAIRRGAYDYISKPYDVAQIKLVVDRALRHRGLSTENRRLKREIRDRYALQNVIGRSEAMLQVYKTAARVALTDATVLVFGESGTGKELVARAIHGASARAAQPFIAVDCGAIAEGVLESELFGHARGSFTGATGARKGLFEEASGGTLFLDEIGDVGPRIQGQLLRVLQEGEIRRVGESQAVRVDTRVVAASNKDLAEAARQGKFPRGPLLPAQRGVDRAAAASRTARGHPAARRALRLAARGRARRQRHHRGARGADGVRLAGERPRAGERGRARPRPNRAAPSSSTICPRRCGGARGRPRRRATRRPMRSCRAARRWTSSTGATPIGCCASWAETRRARRRRWASIARRSRGCSARTNRAAFRKGRTARRQRPVDLSNSSASAASPVSAVRRWQPRLPCTVVHTSCATGRKEVGALATQARGSVGQLRASNPAQAGKENPMQRSMTKNGSKRQRFNRVTLVARVQLAYEQVTDAMERLRSGRPEARAAVVTARQAPLRLILFLFKQVSTSFACTMYLSIEMHEIYSPWFSKICSSYAKNFRMLSAISCAWVSRAKCPVSKNSTFAFGLSRLNASAPGGRKKGSFFPQTAKNFGLCVRKYFWNSG